MVLNYNFTWCISDWVSVAAFIKEEQVAAVGTALDQISWACEFGSFCISYPFGWLAILFLSVKLGTSFLNRRNYVHKQKQTQTSTPKT